MKKIISLVAVISLILGLLCGCASTQTQTPTDTEPQKQDEPQQQTEEKSDDIVILFTNDIHCGVDKNISISKIAAYRNYMKTKTDNVLLVDCGDSIQGSSLGSVTKGGFSVDVMNEVGYDFAIFGNHEFDFGQARLLELLNTAKAQYLCCNITYSGSGETPLSKTKPYEIVKFGDKSVALIGVTTPRTIGDSAMINFLENDKFVYDFCGGEDDSALAACVQKNVDEARQNGADYVVVLSHLGLGDGDIMFGSDRLIRATNGIDAVLDGHSHETYTKVCIDNKDGNPVILAQTGTELANLGQLVISEDGMVSVTMIDELTKDDETVKNKIATLSADYESLFSTVVAHSDTELSAVDSDGVRMVRNRESNIGDLCADAYRIVSGADIAYVNGGGVRAGLPAGDITYQNIIDVHPFGNMLCVVEVTGQEICDMLEYFVQSAKPETVNEDKTLAVGENGSFPNMSGITFTVDTRIDSPVIMDENETLTGIDETKTRRVSDVKVLNGDTYEPIDLNKTYTLASHNYMILNGGCGMKELLADHVVLQNCTMADYQVLINYIEGELKGNLSEYKEPISRINFLR